MLVSKSRITLFYNIHEGMTFNTAATHTPCIEMIIASDAGSIYNFISGIKIAKFLLQHVRMAEWSKAPDSRVKSSTCTSEHSGPRMWAWVQIPLLTTFIF